MEKKEIGAEKKEELPHPEHKKELGHGEQTALADSGAEAKELRERLMRLQAEFENYKKRSERESMAARERTEAGMLLKLLPIVDEFEIAVSHMEHAHAKEFRHGVELIYAKLRDLLKKEGVEEMKAEGESFDPYRHEALRQGDGEEGKVVDVVLKGYLFKGKVLRHAKVVVGKEGKHGSG
ncbi:MAG: nucleotide exchange factor GrpE [Candidatus Micrarchaeota archaeon]